MKPRERVGFVVTLALLFSCSRWDAKAQPLIYQATGNREQVQSMVEQFKHDIIYGVGADEGNPPSILSVVRATTFDDLALGNEATVGSGGAVESGGLFFACLPGSRFLISAGTTDPNNQNRLFGDVNPGYTAEFAAFTDPSIMAVQDPFGRPGDQWIYAGPYFPGVKAFGAVFVDVDSDQSASISSFYADGGDPLSVKGLQLQVPAAPGRGNFSFIGFLLNEGQGVYGANTGISLPGLTPGGEGGMADMVAIDEIIYGVVPEPSPLVLVFAGGVLTWIAARRQRSGRRRTVSV